jgi:hypothetical protein
VNNDQLTMNNGPWPNGQLPAASNPLPVANSPRLLSTVICEDILFNADQALSLYRAVFKRQTSSVFPAQMRCLYVVTIRIGHGVVDQRVLILAPDKSEALYDCYGQIPLAGEQQVAFANRFQWIVWPAPGVYWLRVLDGQQPLSDDIPIVIEAEPSLAGVQP